jgi:hypothetical protein
MSNQTILENCHFWLSDSALDKESPTMSIPAGTGVRLEGEQIVPPGGNETDPISLLAGRILIYPDGHSVWTGLDIAPLGYLKPPWRVRLKPWLYRLKRRLRQR